MLKTHALHFESTHYGMERTEDNLDERIAFALESGQKQMILSSFGLPEKATMGDWMMAADKLNEIGNKTKTEGIQTGYHNHDMEFEKLDGQLIYDALVKNNWIQISENAIPGGRNQHGIQGCGLL